MTTKVRLLQILIVLGCIGLLLNRFFWSSVVEAQSNICNGRPPLITAAPNPQSWAWPPNTTVSVRIYDKSNGQPTTQAEVDAIDSGISSWNTIKLWGCSGVHFNQATRTNTVWPGMTELPGTNEVVVVRTEDRDGQYFHIRNQNLVQVGGITWLRSSFNHTFIPPGKGPLYRVDNLARHEVGHSFGVANGDFTDSPTSVMSMNSFDISNNLLITQCDIDAHQRVYCPSATPTPTPYPTPSEGCLNPVDNFAQNPCGFGFAPDSTGYYCCQDCVYQGREEAIPDGFEPGELDCGVCNDEADNDCDGDTDFADSNCYWCLTPVVVDTAGDGIELTGPDYGAEFDISGTGRLRRLSWVQRDDAWLVLDRNGNGSIDSGKEMFGAATVQYSSNQRNGFLALALYDRPEHGGNSDGVMDRRDAIFDSLRLWMDVNGDGVSAQSELHHLHSFGLRRIDLDYKSSRRKDQYGNEFRYRTKVRDARGAQLGRWAWDVFLTARPSDDPAITSLIAPFKVFQPIKSACRFRRVVT